MDKLNAVVSLVIAIAVLVYLGDWENDAKKMAQRPTGPTSHQEIRTAALPANNFASLAKTARSEERCVATASRIDALRARFCPIISTETICAMLEKETGMCLGIEGGETCHDSSVGAQGPLQITPETYAHYGTDANGNGFNIQSFDDSVASALVALCDFKQKAQIAGYGERSQEVAHLGYARGIYTYTAPEKVIRVWMKKDHMTKEAATARLESSKQRGHDYMNGGWVETKKGKKWAPGVHEIETRMRNALTSSTLVASR